MAPALVFSSSHLTIVPHLKAHRFHTTEAGIQLSVETQIHTYLSSDINQQHPPIYPTATYLSPYCHNKLLTVIHTHPINPSIARGALPQILQQTLALKMTATSIPRKSHHGGP